MWVIWESKHAKEQECAMSAAAIGLKNEASGWSSPSFCLWLASRPVQSMCCSSGSIASCVHLPKEFYVVWAIYIPDLQLGMAAHGLIVTLRAHFLIAISILTTMLLSKAILFPCIELRLRDNSMHKSYPRLHFEVLFKVIIFIATLAEQCRSRWSWSTASQRSWTNGLHLPSESIAVSKTP